MSVKNPELPKPCFVRVICTGDLAAMFILKLRALTSTCHKHERARRVSRSRVAEPLDDRVLGVTVGSVIWVLDSSPSKLRKLQLCWGRSCLSPYWEHVLGGGTGDCPGQR